ncbi:MAG: ribosome biogenesis GTPase Der [Candidatus Peregrinibacteria bacterium]|nr:ribosome biogenesis GTPase Der [Candidatus Peregrinibacteria bacterium]
MARTPTVAIIGRPNTGKSTLFNRLVGRRQAIVSDVPGTTRDHVAGSIDLEGMRALLVDTGGMGGGTEDREIESDVHAQSLLALSHADVILFTINSREELTSSDFAIVEILRKQRRRHVPVILVVTKCDNPATLEEVLAQYYQLGVADTIIPLSAPHGIGIEELREKLKKELTKLHFQEVGEKEETEGPPRVAVIGKPNVGKSSIVNALMSDAQRKVSPKLVSEVAGTTRDATDTIIRHEDREYVFIDTAGLKRHAPREEGIDSFAAFRTAQALQECSVAILVLDATEPVSRQDQRIAGLAAEEGKGLIIALNKIDKLKAEQRTEKVDEIRLELPFCRYAPILPCSALNREGLLKLFALVDMVHRNRTRRIPTKELHRWFTDAAHGRPLGVIAKSKHLTQAEDIPPTFILFVSDPKRVQVTQLRYLENRLRETFGFDGTPVRWVTKRG